MTVTLVTKDATLDDLSVGDYRDIWEEARRLDLPPKERISFDKVIALCGSTLSKAQWAKYENGDITLTRQMRNDLRRLVGRSELPPTVAEATAQASPDAAVWSVGDGVPDTVIMVSGDPVTLHVNGSVQVAAQNRHVTKVTRPPRRFVRPVVSECQNARFMALQGAKWCDVIDAGLTALEGMR